MKKINKFAGDYFAVIVIIVAGIALMKPGTFLWVLPNISLLLGIIMFGMGITLKASDFKLLLLRPKDILLGVGAQYIIMPLLAFGLAKTLNLPAEIAVGVILVGTCPGGTASNVMTYLAKGDVALSVAMTSVSTLLAPILTPAITWLLAGQWLSVAAGDMFISIFKIVLIPVVLGVVINKLLGDKNEKITSFLPLISVIAIVLIVGGVVGGNAEKIITTGLLIFAVVILHNTLGLLLGYCIGRLMKADEAKCRAISIEVGMQNSGLATSLAMVHFSPVAAIPGAIFSVWHNISGPILATYWSRKEVNKQTK